ncbi:MAG: radical SAM peptide maturase, CXXX-repeat target family [Bacteroides sp.]
MRVQEGSRSLARTVTFQVTDDCNLKCSYCYQINKGKHLMDFDIAKRFIDILLDADENSNTYINPGNSPAVIIEFIGGEPFLAIELIDKITDYFISQMIEKQHPWATRYMISISSNGVLYFEPKVQAYIKKHFHHLSFNISIDGNKELHDACRIFPNGSGSYDIAMRGVRHFTDVLHGRMGSKMTLAPENVRYTADAVKGLIESGYTEINLNCVYEKGWEQEHATILYYQLKELADYIIGNNLQDEVFVAMFQEFLGLPIPETDLQNWCGGLGYMISVDYKGDIFPCIRYMESSLGTEIEPIIIGNVYEGIMATKKQCDWVNCMNCVNRRTESSDECFNCPIARGCAWCSAYNYQETGTVNKRVTYICEMHKARCLANRYYWQKVYAARKQDKEFALNVPKDWALKIISEEEFEMLESL